LRPRYPGGYGWTTDKAIVEDFKRYAMGLDERISRPWMATSPHDTLKSVPIDQLRGNDTRRRLVALTQLPE
jgi:hypothetical protein